MIGFREKTLVTYGYRGSGGGGFNSLGVSMYWWYSTAYVSNVGYYGSTTAYTSVIRHIESRSYGFGVRCVGIGRTLVKSSLKC